MDWLSMLRDIPQYSHWLKMELVDKGWSDDQKIYIEDITGQKMLLRLTDVKQYERKRWEYEKMEQLSVLGIRMSSPLDFGVCGHGQYVYSLFTWVPGKEAELALPSVDEDRQYSFGCRAGEILQAIHGFPAPDDQEDWGHRYRQKIHRYIERYNHCSVRLENDHVFLHFIEENLPYVNDRLQTFQHGDYHVGNLIITPDQDIGVIDFNRMNFGDPWEEFRKYIFSWRASIPFTIGQIHGYFRNSVPDEFFRLMALYVAANAVGSIPWAIPFGRSSIQTMLNNAREVFGTYDGFKTYIPTWYKDPNRLG